MLREKVLFNDLVLVFKCVNGLAPDLLTVQQFTTRTQVDVTVLWSPDVDYQWDKGHFIFGVQMYGMGYLTILRTLQILIVLSGDILIGYFIRNNFEFN